MVSAVRTGRGKPRYQELADELRAEILHGTYPDPSQFPTENALCTRYGVSRFTVREALRALQNEGLIQRKRGSGTVIKPASERGGALHQPMSNVGEILQYARDTTYRFKAMGPIELPAKLAVHVGDTSSGGWYHFQGLRSRDGDDLPMAVTDAYVHPDLAAAAIQIEPSEDTLFRQLERLADLKIAHITQDIQAVPASARVSAALEIPRRSPCLRILRCFTDNTGRLFEISASYHPGDRFAYTVHIDAEK